MRIISSVLGALTSALRNTFFIAILVGSLMSLTTSIAITSNAAVFSFASGVVDAVRPSTSIAARHRAETGDLKAKNAKLRDEIKKLRFVTYRGVRTTVGTAISSTRARIQKRLSRGASLNAAATFGEALPIAGVAVIVASTAVELAIACETMKDLKALELAIYPSAKIDESSVCGVKAPSKEVIWRGIASAPQKIWRDMSGRFGKLEVNVPPGLRETLIGPWRRFFHWLRP